MKKYRIARIYEASVLDIRGFETEIYREAYWKAIDEMRIDKKIVSCIIFSTKGTAIVIARKWADNPNHG